MKKIFTIILPLALAVFSASAQTTLDVTATPANCADNVYIIKSNSRGGYLANASSALAHTSHTKGTMNHFWYATKGTADGSYNLYELSSGKAIAEGFTLGDTPIDLYLIENPQASGETVISTTATIGSDASCLNAVSGTTVSTILPTSSDYEGASWTFEKVPGIFISKPQGLECTSNSTQYTYESNAITLSKATSKLRFRVLDVAAFYNSYTATNANKKFDVDGSGDFVYFALGGFRLYNADGNSVSLTTDNFSANATHSSDGKGLSALCDNDKSTHYHTIWASSVGDYHYFEISLPSEMSSFKFGFDARSGNYSNVPVMLQILTDENIPSYSNDYSTYTSVKTAVASLDLTQYVDHSASGSPKYNGYTGDITKAKEAAQAYQEYLLAVPCQLSDYTSIGSYTLQTPAEGDFLRIKTAETSETKCYLSSGKNSSNSRATFTADKNGTTVFYYTNGHLLAYGTGYYLADNSNFAGYGDVGSDAATSIEFSASTTNASNYNIKFGDSRYLYCDSNGYTNAGSSTGTDTRYTYQLEEVTALPLTVSAAGYATFIAPVAVSIPDDATAYTVKIDGSTAKLTPLTSTVPANTGVVVKASQGTHEFPILSGNTETAESDLSGSIEAKTIDSNSTVYGLGQVDGVVAFYRMNSTDRTVYGSRAYYTVPSSSSIAQFAFDFGGDVTSIGSVNANGTLTVAPAYDLSGRRITKAAKGTLYIQNGKKFIAQ
jgi:hypothetical protein